VHWRGCMEKDEDAITQNIRVPVVIVAWGLIRLFAASLLIDHLNESMYGPNTNQQCSPKLID